MLAHFNFLSYFHEYRKGDRVAFTQIIEANLQGKTGSHMYTDQGLGCSNINKLFMNN